MRHRNGYRKLSKPTDQRLALLKGLVESLFTFSRIKTTDTRAKEARRLAEQLITLGKKGTLAARRQALRIIPRHEIVGSIFEVAKRFSQRNGGYTRIVKLGRRQGDGVAVSLLELVE